MCKTVFFSGQGYTTHADLYDFKESFLIIACLDWPVKLSKGNIQLQLGFCNLRGLLALSPFLEVGQGSFQKLPAVLTICLLKQQERKQSIKQKQVTR